ncbi:MAG: methyltransferase domain-containing protein [Desulfatibacillum sp.]|nr:methyltransferase domain-containing protein [Desulfatibacillum sp.]
MTQLKSELAASVEFQVKWNSDHAAHEENFYVDRVHFWRDLLPAKMKAALLESPPGAWTHTQLKAGQGVDAYSSRLVKALKLAQVDEKSLGRAVRGGRFYPRGVLKDVGGIFPQNRAPFRVSTMNGHGLTADFNHPLAGRELTLKARVAGNISNKEGRGGSCLAVEDILGVGPGMQARANGCPTDFFYPGAFEREDPARDTAFYQQPRMVNHIDTRAMEVVSGLYGRVLKKGMDVLDLMASWNSHIPGELELKSVHGLGMNQEELENNPRLSGFTVQDLNESARLPYEDNSFDAVICTVSVEYLTHPLAVFQDVARVLRPGGVFVVTFSNRWFPPKAVDVWKEAHDFERMGLVTEYFLQSEAFKELQTYSMQGLPRPDDDKYADELYCSDPVFGVWGVKA